MTERQSQDRRRDSQQPERSERPEPGSLDERFYRPERKHRSPFALEVSAVQRDDFDNRLVQRRNGEARPAWLVGFRNPQYGERLEDH